MRRLPVVALLLLSSVPLFAEPHWIKAASSNFELYTTAGEKKAREGILHFERVRSFFLKSSGLQPAKGRVRIVAFQSDKEYLPYRINAGAAAHAGGGLDHDEIVMRSISEENYPVAVHEFVHILLKREENLPLWLNEGEAELYSSLTPIGKKVRVGDLLPGRLLSLRESKWLDLETLCAVQHDSSYYNDKDKQPIFYAESWALAHMLVLDERYRPKNQEFLHQIHAGADASDAFYTAFGKHPWEIWQDLQAYVRRDRFNVAIFDVTLEKSAEDPEIHPATPFESSVVLAGILADIPQKHDEAKQAFMKLESNFPPAPEIAEGLGYLAWRAHDPKEARTQFAKAVALGSKNPRLYYDYAGLAGDASERRILLLRKAVELDPDFRDARLQLGYALMSAEDYKGAMVCFAGMKKIQPKAAFQFFYGVAYAQYRLGERENARHAAERASGYARNPGEKASIEQLIDALNRAPEPSRLEQRSEEAEEKSEGSSGTLDRVRPALRRQAPQQTEAQGRQPPEIAPPPVLRRRSRTTVVGTIEQLDCLDEVARLRLRTGGQTLNLLMNDPKSIEIRGVASGTVDFTCGPQKPRRVLVEYEPATDSAFGTAGVVRAIEFQ